MMLNKQTLSWALVALTMSVGTMTGCSDDTTTPTDNTPKCSGTACAELYLVLERSGGDQVTEDGQQIKLGVRLAVAPKQDVTVTLKSSDDGEVQVAPQQLTFTSENWNGVQEILITGVDDDLVDGEQTAQLSFEFASADARFNGLEVAPIDIVNVDNDSAGVAVGTLSGPTNEQGSTATFDVALTSEPSADVTIKVESGDPTEGSVEPASITFTPQNWKAPQTITITGVDDDIVDGEQSYELTLSAQSADANYNGLTIVPVMARNIDDDMAGITLGQVSGDTTEAGGTATFTVVLNSMPAASVLLSLDSSDATEGVVGATTITFTTENWNTPQTVTVTGQDDKVADGDQAYTITFGAITSDDADYAALTLDAVSLKNLDDETAGINVSPISGDTTEAGGAATFAVVLDSEPTADVVLSFDTSDATEGVVDVTTLTFTAQNWDTAQTVTVTGQDDKVADGDQPYTITFSPVVSADGAYAAIAVANVSLSNIDDDVVGVDISPISGDTTEAGGAATFTVVLTSEPTGDVAISFDSSDATEGAVSTTSLAFDAQNWDTPQTVTITGKDDAIDDGDVDYSVTFSAITGADAAYSALSLAAITLKNLDDDQAGFDMTALTSNTDESGASGSFSIKLTSEPTADVTVNLDSSDATEGAVDFTTLTFTPQNWDTAQTVTVTGQDDDVADGDQSYSVSFSNTTSMDATYAALTPASVAVINADDDAEGFAISAPSGTQTTEGGGAVTFTVALTSEPTADVIVAVSSSDATEGAVSPATLTFTAQNWDTPQTVTVTGVDDAVSDGSVSYDVGFTVSSVDPGYDGTTLPPITLINADDEIPAVGTTGNFGVISGDGWKVCRADASTAWVSANSNGTYNAEAICQNFGYARVDAQGGTCGTVCGYCGTAGRENYDGGGGAVTSLRFTVHWRCAR